MKASFDLSEAEYEGQILTIDGLDVSLSYEAAGKQQFKIDTVERKRLEEVINYYMENRQTKTELLGIVDLPEEVGVPSARLCDAPIGQTRLH